MDLWAAGLALPLFIIAGWPLLGWLVASLIWLGQRLVQAAFRSKIANSQQPRAIVALTVVSTMVRAWGAGLVILVVGLRSEEVGLAAAIMIAGLFTIYFMTSLMQRYVEGGQK